MSECPFCNKKIIKAQMLYENKFFYVFTNNNPIVEGHIMLIPKRHVRTERDLTAEEQRLYWDGYAWAVQYCENNFGHYPATFENSPSDQSVSHLHRHFLPHVFGVHGIDKLLRKSHGALTSLL